MKYQSALRLTVIAALSAALFGCSSTTSTPAVSTTPGVGSTFTVFDSTSVAVTVSTGVYTVSAANGNVMTVSNPPGPFNDTTRYWYQFSSDGNFWMDPKPSGSRSDYFRFPFATQAQVTTTDYMGSDTIVTTAIGEGTGTYTVNGQSYPTQKVKVTMTTSGGSGSSALVSHWAYAPAIGYFVSYDEEETSLQGAPQPADHKRLLSFVKK